MLWILISLGLDVREVAHDYQPAIKNYLEKELKCLNSFDTWHGMHNNVDKGVCVHVYIQKT